MQAKILVLGALLLTTTSVLAAPSVAHEEFFPDCDEGVTGSATGLFVEVTVECPSGSCHDESDVLQADFTAQCTVTTDDPDNAECTFGGVTVEEHCHE